MRAVTDQFCPWSPFRPVCVRTLLRHRVRRGGLGWSFTVEQLQAALDELVARGDLVAYTFDAATPIGEGVVGEQQYRPR